MIEFEKDVCKFLGIPSIPKKEHDGKSSFQKGVALLELSGAREAYAVASFDADKDKKPNIVKVFGIEPFVSIKQIFVVPTYMTTEDEIKDMDLDEQSKKKVQQVLNEAKEIENEGTEEENPMKNLPEWIFEEIHSKDEAVAWLRNFQSRNKQKGRIPTTEENIKLRLYSIYTELQNKTK